MNTLKYSDHLVEITDDSILLRGYYFPFGDKRIRFSEIIDITVKEPTFLNGKYRIYGSEVSEQNIGCNGAKSFIDGRVSEALCNLLLPLGLS